MLRALPATGDLVVRYERMLERFLEAPVSVVCTSTAPAPGPEHQVVRALVEAGGGPVVAEGHGDELSPHPELPGLGIAAVAAWPLLGDAGEVIGALGVLDHEPRYWTRDDLDTIADLAEACSGEMAHQRGQAEAERQAVLDRELTRRSRVLLALSESLSSTRTLDDIAFAVEQVAVDQLDCLHAGIWLLHRARDASERDELRYLDDPWGRWPSAGRNAVVALDAGNPVGAVVTSGRPLLMATVEEQNRRFPQLDTTQQVGGTRFLMPLELGQTLGVLALIWEQEQTLSDEHRLTIATLASYVAQAVQRAQLLAEREQVSSTLQAAMLPHLPQVPGLELAARYLPAAQHDRVGGDWYDAVVTHGGSTDLVIGDVAGHDIAAAAVMGEVRSMLRAFSLGQDASPAATVTRLDRALDSFGVDRFASLVYVRAHQPDGSGRRRLHWTNAGHFPPLLVRPDGTAELLEDPEGQDLLVGVDAAGTRHDREDTVPEGSVLVLFTDGLVERRGECVSIGLERLRTVASRYAGCQGKDLAPLLDRLVEELVGPGNEDDVAVLAVRLVG